MPSLPMLTPHQLAALTDAHHLCVTANAGSGKTLVLVERYFRLVVDGHASVREIVALTFTEKAASELRRKIAERVTAALQQAADPTETARLEDFRVQLPSAIIGTIHSFCGLLLREHPVEADVDAAFSVLEGLDQRTLLEEAVSEAFRALLRGRESDPLRLQCAELVGALGRRRVIALVTSLVQKREHLLAWITEGGLYTLPDDQVIGRWDREIEKFLLVELRGLRLQADLDLVVGAGVGDAASAGRGHLETLRRPVDPATAAHAFRQFLELAITKRGGIQKSFAGRGDPPEATLDAAGRLARWRRELEPVLIHVASGSPALHHQKLLSAIRVLCAVAQRAMEVYDQRKRDAGQLDFEDLQIRARSLLRNEAVRDRLAARFRFVMVDEYQDTNQLQYDILLPLLRHLDSGNLFIVGDPKQSIYGFRNADVAVFIRTREDLRRVAGGAADVVLDESFRPLLDIAAFVNVVFGHTMGSGDGLEGISYESLVRARQNAARGAVEIMLNGAEDSGRSSEADRIARRILQLINDRHPVFDKSERERPVCFRDIALLLRSRILVPEIEEAFLRHGIPYLVSAGVGYFQTQDILDFYNYCVVLLNPHADAALAGILRSPFFGISDAELFEQSLRRGRTSLWDTLRAALDADRGVRDPLHDALVALQEDCAVAQTLTVPELLARIVRRRLYTSTLAGTARGPQALANLEKLQRIARAFDGQGFNNLYDFAGKLRRLIDEEEREGQGAIENEGDAVQIMTIHAAKGLEFPVVVIPRIDRSFLYDREPLFDREVGVGFAVGQDEEDDSVVAPLLAMLKERNRRNVLAEEKRIFYVAATRARDMLILSGSEGASRSLPTCLSWLAESLGGETRLHGRSITVPVRTATLVSSGGGFVAEAIDHELVIPVRRGSERAVPAMREPVGGEAVVPPPMLLGVLPAPPKPEIFSATRIRTYLQCPAKFYLRYLLGFPEGAFVPSKEDDEVWEQSHPADLLGRAFHAVMERVDPVEWSGQEILHAAELFLRKEKPLDPGDLLEAASRVASLVEGVLGSPFWSFIASGSEARTEYTMTCPLGTDYIMGTVDRVFRDPDGFWHVIDYKTDTVGEGELAQRVEEYAPQIGFYALLVSKFFDAETVRGTLVFAAAPGRPIRGEFKRGDLERLEREIASAIGGIRSGLFEPRPTQCHHCPFPAGACRELLPKYA